MSDTQLYINQRPVRLEILNIHESDYDHTYKNSSRLDEFIEDISHIITNVEWDWLIDNGVPMLDPGMYLTGIINNATTALAYDMNSRQLKPVMFNERCRVLTIRWNYQD